MFVLAGQLAPDQGRSQDLSSRQKLRSDLLLHWMRLSERCDKSQDVFRFREQLAHAKLDSLHSVHLDKGRARVCLVTFPANSAPLESCGYADIASWKAIDAVYSKSGFWDAVPESIWIPDALSWTLDACVSGVYHSLMVYPHRDASFERPVDAIRQLVASTVMEDTER